MGLRPRRNSWTAKANLPTARGALAAAVLGSKIYAIGGRDAGQGLGSTEVYDPAADAWQTADDLPTPRDQLAAAVIGNRIYATGGRLTSYARNMPVTEEYDPILDELSRRAPLPTTRSGIGAATVQGRLYVFGGEARKGLLKRTRFMIQLWTGGRPRLQCPRPGMASVWSAWGTVYTCWQAGPLPAARPAP